MNAAQLALLVEAADRQATTDVVKPHGTSEARGELFRAISAARAYLQQLPHIKIDESNAA